MIAVREVIAMTALNFGIDAAVILSADSRKATVQARHIAMYVARKSLRCSTITLGEAFGRDHTSVIYAIEKIETELKAAPASPLAALIHSLAKNVEFRQRIEQLGGIDVISTARRISAAPVNRAIGASVMEIAALSATVLDLWEIALTAEELIALADRRSGAADDELPDIDRTIAALSRAISDELAAMRGPTQEGA